MHRTGRQTLLNSEAGISYNKDALPWSLVAEALKLHTNDHDKRETFDSSHFRLMMRGITITPTHVLTCNTA
jgi:hypothetical protein